MVTKWKGWTARRAVKIISFILFIALCIALVTSAYSVIRRADDTHISPDIVFSSASGSEYFYNMNIPNAYYSAAVIAYYKSEASINAGEHLKWFEYENGAWLSSPDDSWSFVWLNKSEDTPEERERLWSTFKREQLSEYRLAKSELARMAGLLYRIDFANNIAGMYNYAPDSAEKDAEDIRSHPVYLIRAQSGLIETSHSGNYSMPYTRYSSSLTGESIYLAFTREAVDAQYTQYNAARSGYIRDVTFIALSSLLLIALLIILILGTGRTVSDGGEAVHFHAADKLPLDFSAALVFCWLALMVSIAIRLGYSIEHYGNYSAIVFMLGIAAIVFAAPVLLWLLSLAKRMKARGFWRHTVVYMILRGIARWVRSLWCGFPLTAKVGIIGAASFCALVFNGFVGATREGFLIFFVSLVITAGAVLLLLRYARRLHVLDRGAADVSSGNYGVAINAGGGELGSIADSITNISDGINNAVDQRLKSERLKTELITNVSHDIRTPLTSIITYTDLLKHEGLGSEKAPEYLDIIMQKSQRLKTLTDELFEAAKAATGNIEVNITELNLTSLINQVLGELDSAVTASGLDLRVKLPEQALVHADGKLLWRVMENLMSNVFKYALPGSRVYLDAQRSGEYVRLELKNISATELNVDPSELTERFKRGDEARAGEGSGLGLSIVQSFVTAQRGRFALNIDGDLFKATVYLPAVTDKP